MLLQVKSQRRWAYQRSTLKDLSAVRLTLTNSVILTVGNIERLRTGEPDTTTKTSSNSLHNRDQINQTITESAVAENISKLRHNQLSGLNLPKTTKPSTMTTARLSINKPWLINNSNSRNNNSSRWHHKEEQMTTLRSSATTQERKWDPLCVMMVKWAKPLHRGQAP
jgi:hypothetical protein